MSDDNVVSLIKDAAGRLRKKEDFPDPGSAEWAKLVLLNMFATVEEDKKLLILEHLSTQQLEAFSMHLVGNLLELLITPTETYNKKVKEKLTEPPEDPDTEQWLLGTIADVCKFVHLDDDFINQFVGRDLTLGKVYGFYLAMVKSFEIISVQK